MKLLTRSATLALTPLLALSASNVGRAQTEATPAEPTPNAPIYTPRPRPDHWPFAITTVPCPYWASPNYPHDYYRQCHDRPIMTGENRDGSLWQTQQLQKWLPGGIMLADIFADVLKPQGPGQFGNYIEAARKVPGARVAPLLDIVQPDASSGKSTAQQREDAAFLQFKGFFDAFGNDPTWWSVNGAKVFTDYSTGGLGAEAVGRVSQRLQNDGHAFFWLSDTSGGSPLLAALYGQIDDDAFNKAMRHVSGPFSFGAPVNYSQGGFPKLARVVRSFESPRVFCMGTNPGHYSARGNMRNHEAARGTSHMRRDLEAALILRPDVINAQTWNDYVEAAHVEPSYKHSSALLEILRHYGEALRGQPHQKSAQPHLFASYRKAVFAGEPLQIELLNLPVAKPFGALHGRVEVRNTRGKTLAKLPFALRGERRQSVNLTYRVPSYIKREMFDMRVLVSAKRGRKFAKTFLNLPPVPIISDGKLADPLTFTVPLHRLYTTRPVSLLLNERSNARVLPFPRRVNVLRRGLPTIDGVSYERSGHIINDPTVETRTRATVDNFPVDPFRFALLPFEHYGAMVHFRNGQIAYSNGAWVRDAETSAGRVWADYEFMGDFNGSGEYRREFETKLRDRSGHDYHGNFAKIGDAGTLPTWTHLTDLHDALTFNGQSAVDLPGALSFPIGPATVELVVKPSARTQPQQLVAQGGELLNLMIETDGRVRARHTNVDREFDDALSQTRLRPDEWAHIVATFDTTRMRLFINGRLEAEVATDGLRPNEGAKLGAPFWGGNDPRRGPYTPFVGQIARFRVLQGASSAGQIASDYRALSPIYRTL